jgi:uncharacterized protein
MVRIGLLSDTHSFIDDSISHFFDNVDEIWHAGDIGNLAVIEKLKQKKPVRAVYGNIDNHEIRLEIPEFQIFKHDQVDILMTHIGGYPGKYAPGIAKKLVELKPKLFIAGHSHILKVMYDKKYNCLFMNPGAAGISGFHQVQTMLRFVIAGDQIKDLEVWEKAHR